MAASWVVTKAGLRNGRKFCYGTWYGGGGAGTTTMSLRDTDYSINAGIYKIERFSIDDDSSNPFMVNQSTPAMLKVVVAEADTGTFYIEGLCA